MDYLEGDPFSPLSLHGYLYARNEPVSAKDPSGLATVVEEEEAVEIQITLQSLALPLLGLACTITYALPIGLEQAGIDFPQKGPCTPKKRRAICSLSLHSVPERRPDSQGWILEAVTRCSPRC